MDALLIAIAFLFGLVVSRFGLPPLLGFLAAGFVLHAFGKEGGDTLAAISDFGVKLLLFTIGLKLQVRSLLRPEVWAGATGHAVITTAVFAGGLALTAAFLPLPNLSAILILAFALCFSSTVFAVKMLEANGEMGALHGRIAIGILIMQDLVAVLFLAVSKGQWPSPWALLLIGGLFAARPLLGWVMSQSGHGELITLCGLFLALVVGGSGFEFVGLKADLGALFIGILVGTHPKAKELGKSLLGLTDLLLVGFFLSVGLEGLPGWQGLLTAAVLALVLPAKGFLFFLILTRFRLRARTSWLAGLNLTTYGEFGLIVIAIGAGKGWIGSEWLPITAIALSISFLIASPLNRNAEALYQRFAAWLHRFETAGRHPDDIPVRTNGERIAVFGMGRVGQAAYSALTRRFPGKVIAFDRDPAEVERHRAAGRNVVLADATDTDFWQHVRPRDDIDLVVLAMPVHSANLHAAETLQRLGYEGVVTATGQFPDEISELRTHGVDSAFNLYSEAGDGFARHTYNVFNQQRPDLTRAFRPAPDDGKS